MDGVHGEVHPLAVHASMGFSSQGTDANLRIRMKAETARNATAAATMLMSRRTDCRVVPSGKATNDTPPYAPPPAAEKTRVWVYLLASGAKMCLTWAPKSGE